MRLDQLLKHFSYESVQGSHDLIITDICYHSGKVKRGSLFVCIKGQYTDGHDYIMDAVNAGAFAVVVDVLFTQDMEKCVCMNLCAITAWL